MTEETKKRSNPDYSSSAVKLNNPPEVKGLMDEWLEAKDAALEADKIHLAAVSELPSTNLLTQATIILNEARQNLEGAIKEFGGYQDTELGLYALQQVRKTVTYDAEVVKAKIPEFADKILAQVDTTILKGLLRGKLITQEQVDACATVKESLRFVIEAVSQ